MHGLGADGHDFEPIVPELRLALPIRFVFPHAPLRPVTINGGMQMRAWYDVDPSNPVAADTGIQESTEQLQELIDRELDQGLNPNQIALAGFSQGGVIALHLGMRVNHAFAGILALSTYLHGQESNAKEVTFASVDTPIFMAHGSEDVMIPLSRAVMSRNVLTDLNYEVEWHQYQMGHQVCFDEVQHISHFLNQIFSQTP